MEKRRKKLPDPNVEQNQLIAHVHSLGEIKLNDFLLELSLTGYVPANLPSTGMPFLRGMSPGTWGSKSCTTMYLPPPGL